MRIISILFCLVMLSQNAFAQNMDLSTPENTIKTLFKAMYDGDGTSAAAVFADEVSLNSVFTTKEGEQKVNTGDVAKFVEAIGTPHDDVWDERISELTVKIDGDLASAWMNYEFYRDDQFSHCGVNAMHLIRKDGNWKIFQIIDTRRKSDCN